jgi:hypothetical protein
MIARYNLIGWIKACTIGQASNKLIIKFIKEDIIFWYNRCKTLIVNKGLENKGLMKDLTTKYRIKYKITSTYYP